MSTLTTTVLRLDRRPSTGLTCRLLAYLAPPCACACAVRLLCKRPHRSDANVRGGGESARSGADHRHGQSQAGGRLGQQPDRHTEQREMVFCFLLALVLRVFYVPSSWVHVCTKAGARRCQPRAPAWYRGVGVGVCLVLGE